MSERSDVRRQLQAMVATMLMVPEAEVAETTSLAALNTSLGAAKVRLGLKRLGLSVPVGAKPATFGGLMALLSGEPSAERVSGPEDRLAPLSTPALPGPTGRNGSAAGLMVGLDVEDIATLPEARDYWEHEFYKGSFAASEIAYAVLHPEPRVHFAGFWCAKEALRKCDAAYLGVAAEKTAVAHDADGQPYLSLITEAGRERLAHALSITHTATVAAAVVVAGMAAPAAVAETIAPMLKAAMAEEAKQSRGLARLFGI